MQWVCSRNAMRAVMIMVWYRHGLCMGRSRIGGVHVPLQPSWTVVRRSPMTCWCRSQTTVGHVVQVANSIRWVVTARAGYDTYQCGVLRDMDDSTRRPGPSPVRSPRRSQHSHAAAHAHAVYGRGRCIAMHAMGQWDSVTSGHWHELPPRSTARPGPRRPTSRFGARSDHGSWRRGCRLCE